MKVTPKSCYLAIALFVALVASSTNAQVEAALAQGIPSLAPIIERVAPAVVNISVKQRTEAPMNPFFSDERLGRFFRLPDSPRYQERLSAGSGVIIDAKHGYVVTNHHVVENASEILITLSDQRTFAGELLGSDPRTDVALLQMDGTDLTELPLSDSESLRVGDFVIAIGNPFGLGQSVTSGIVSALGRHQLNSENYEDFIQTDASINPREFWWRTGYLER